MLTDFPIHSPIEEISEPLFSEKGVRVFVKRDDMIHPFISGNKWRKLKYQLAEAGKTGKSHLVTFGGAFSNHLLATACAAAKFKFKSTGFVRGEEVSNDVLTLCRLFGMTLIFSEREAYRDKKALFSTHFGKRDDAFFIDEGGCGHLAVKGSAELIDELHELYEHIICAAGTGATCAGIIKGIQEASLVSKVHVIPVLKGGDFLAAEIEQYTTGNFEIHTGYHFGGYARTDSTLISFIENFCRSSGILIEPVYTGKMFFALYDLVKEGTFRRGDKILAIHTGGLTGILGMTGKFTRE